MDGWLSNPANAFSINTADGAIASMGGVRGTCYTANKYSFYRMIFSVRQVQRNGHDQGVIFFGSDGAADALKGVMFALPDSWGWDYRNGSVGAGNHVADLPNVNVAAWARCELLVNANTGLARAACAQPVTAKAVELITFQANPPPKAPGYFGMLCHNGKDSNGGIQEDEYKDITIEVNPAVDDLITTK